MSTTLIDKINNTALYADRSVNDKNGYDIADTYVAKTALSRVAFTGDYNDIKNQPSIQAPLQSTESIQVASNALYVNLVENGSGQNISGISVESTQYPGSNGVGETYTDGGSATKTYFKFDSFAFNSGNDFRIRAIGSYPYDSPVYTLFVQGSQYSDITSGSVYGFSSDSTWLSNMFQESGQTFYSQAYSGNLDFSQPFMVFFVFSSASGDPKYDVDNYVVEYTGSSIRFDYPGATPVSTQGLKVNAAQVKQQMNLATVASSGSYNDLSNKPTIPTVPTAGNMLSTTNNVLNVTTTAGITDIQLVQSMPAQPVATVLYLLPEN